MQAQLLGILTQGGVEVQHLKVCTRREQPVHTHRVHILCAGCSQADAGMAAWRITNILYTTKDTRTPGMTSERRQFFQPLMLVMSPSAAAALRTCRHVTECGTSMAPRHREVKIDSLTILLETCYCSGAHLSPCVLQHHISLVVCADVAAPALQQPKAPTEHQLPRCQSCCDLQQHPVATARTWHQHCVKQMSRRILCRPFSTTQQ
jgi:hypothetical protein